MATFTVNGKKTEVVEEKRLINYLRYNLHLTSVKDGCSEGACGSCTILVDGVPTRACTLVTTEVAGKNIITVEGLSDREKDIFTYAFGESGAVQCGYCTPGMVMCAKGLLDRNASPTEKEIRHAIRNNLCRCTGYVKIVKAIQMAAALFRNEKQISDGPVNEHLMLYDDRNWLVGERVHRVDVRDKVTGAGKYPDDIYMEDQLNVVAVRSKYPRAKVLSIDTSLAEEVPGVFAIFTAKDVPGDKKVGHIKKDWDALIDIGEITRYRGDVIALVTADTRLAANKARDLVKVEYEVLPCVRNPQEAMADGAPLVHEEGNLLGETHVDRGDVDKALSESDIVLSGHFETPWTEHAFIETECAFSIPLENGGVKIYSTDQSVYDTRRETAPFLGLPEEMVVVENCYVGGGFGGKEDVTVQHLSAMAAMLTKRPCKMKLSRQESLEVHPKRHPMSIDMTMGCRKDGTITALKAKLVTDTGAYASLGLPVLQRACTHASGPYNYQNFKIDGYAWYTNNPPAGAFRGFGVTQSCFAVETMINRLADKAGISRWEMRYKNAIRPGQVMPNGQIADKYTGLAETLEAVKKEFYSNEHVGIACAMKNAGVGVGLPDYGRVDLEVKDGKVVIHCGGSCLGQGLCTVLKQMVCSASGLDGSFVVEEKSRSDKAPDSGTSSGSRHTTVTGEAARRAAVKLKEALEKKSLKELEGEHFYAEYLAKTDEFGSKKEHPVSHVAYGFATQLCILDPKTHKVERMIAAHDVGRAINPTNVEGQIEGGVVMGLGYALREHFDIKDCVVQDKFGSLGLFRADEVPEVKALIVEKEGLDTSFGGIGLGEITSIPTAPAVADAYEHLDGEERSVLPLSNTPYAPQDSESAKRPGRVLISDKSKRCIGCKECMRACSTTYFKSEQSALSFIQVRERKGIGNESGISGIIMRPVTCIQCGACARACPKGAITRNRFGVYVVDTKLCDGCGKCAKACPLSLIVLNGSTALKCIACGKCAKVCPMDVLRIENG
ncbi:MAG: selenium-dependent xanthine dehydrogenase [Sphaerochaetaceae bacterium]|nr:selenium-dependent xanthine dehydrogenase [Sphaerochaetaceae bacterium]